MMNEDNPVLLDKQKAYSSIWWKIALIIFSLAMAYLFTAQLLMTLFGFDSSLYQSDMLLHVYGVLEHTTTTYSLFQHLAFVFYYLGSFIGQGSNVTAVAFIIIHVASNVASIIIVHKYLLNYFREKNVSLYWADFLSIALFLVSMPIFSISGSWYLSMGTPNPWHNSTYLMARPFAILFFIYAIKVFNKIKENSKYTKEVILMGLFCLLSCAAKPSFFFLLFLRA